MDPLQSEKKNKTQLIQAENASSRSFQRFKDLLGQKTQFDELTGDILDTIGEYLDFSKLNSDRSN